MQNCLRISLVIPAYNEESHLAECLDSAIAQLVPFDEIIVVDNNSSDTTAMIASSFPGVRLLHEPRQGVVHARNRGFDATTGGIIARIDADTRLPLDWTMQLTRIFQAEQVAAVTGSVAYYDIGLPRTLSWVDAMLRRSGARLLGNRMALQGANMAIRRRAWRAVRHSVCSAGGIHEDFDLAIHTAEQGHRVVYDPQLVAGVAFRQAASPWRAFASYYWHCPKTYLKHGVRRGIWLVPVAIVVILAYPLLHLLLQRALPRNWSLLSGVRVNPATFAD